MIEWNYDVRKRIYLSDVIVYLSLKNYFNTSIRFAYYGVEASCTLSVSRIFGVTVAQEDAALSCSGPLGRVRDQGGLESEGLTLRSGSILRDRTPHTSQMSDSQALTEFDIVTVQGQTGLSPSESKTVTSYTVSVAAADLSHRSDALEALAPPCSRDQTGDSILDWL